MVEESVNIMPCFNTVPISIIPPVSQGVAPLLWQNGNQITRLNIPLNPSFLVYDGTITRWGDGSTTSPVYLPSLQQVANGSINYIVGSIASGAIAKTGLGTNGQFLSTDGVGLVWVNSSSASANNISGGAAGQVLYQSGTGVTAFVPAGTTGQVLTSNGSSAPSWSTNISGNAATATVASSCTGNSATSTIATTATTANSVAAGSVTPSGLSASVGSNAWLIKTSTYAALAGDRISADTTTLAWTLTLPTSPASGTIVTIADGGNNWSTNNLTVSPGGADTINSVVQNLVCNLSGFSFYVFYNGTTWRVLV